MLQFFVIPLAALVASGLSFFSGFGLGTLLMPVTAVFFPVDIAITMTAVVHLANNVFKFGLVGMRADWKVVLRFGVPALFAAFLGASLLGWLSSLPPLFHYTLLGHTRQVEPVKAVIGVIIVVFVFFELSPAIAGMALDRKFLPVGGCVSGFFGGISGHQGAFRSMFLVKAGLDRERFIATGVVLAVMVDLARTAVYGRALATAPAGLDWPLVATVTCAAFAGALAGSRILKKITIHVVRVTVSALLLLVGAGLAAGLF